MTMSLDFAVTLDAINNSEPFALVSPSDLLHSWPDFLLSLSVIDLLATSANAACIPSALAPVFDDLDEQVTFVTEMVRDDLVKFAQLFGKEAVRTEELNVVCQQFTQDAVRFATLTALRDLLRVHSASTPAPAERSDSSQFETVASGSSAANETNETGA